MTIHKCKPSFDEANINIRRAPFTQLYNKVIQTCTNMEAIAVWAYLQSQVDNWELNPTQLKKHFGVGKNKIYKILTYMIGANLLVRHVQIAQNGRRITTSYTVLDGTEFLEPARDVQDGAPLPQNQEVENQEVENEDYRKEREKEKKDIEKDIKDLSASDEAHTRLACAFNEFWNLYPIKKNKVRAKKIWDKYALNQNAEQIMNDVSNRLVNDGQWQELQFIPHPSTYLQNERWHDALTPPKQSKAPKSNSGDALSRVLNKHMNKGRTYDHASGSTIDPLR